MGRGESASLPRKREPRLGRNTIQYLRDYRVGGK
jgi:hypothetical protein